VLKVKTADVELVDMAVKLARLSGEDRLPGLIESHAPIFGSREARKGRPISTGMRNGNLQYCPKIYGT
jgi:hypothetical protein